ncbi:MAG: hypothetical protein D3909_15340, partial [Candidatus Electrothrix sp. ATG1]|nr:hypothetical protein [Candidatus Electrothrix sp. ATG1]
AISCGIYGYPLQQAADIAVKEIIVFLDSHPGKLETVFISCFNQDAISAFSKALEKYKGKSGEAA